MIPELGHFALILALCVALVQSTIPIIGVAKENAVWMAVARPTSQVQCVLLVIAFAVLTASFVNNDLTVRYIASNSNSLLPLAYRISAVWGTHEGSLLLWALILGIWTFTFSVFSKHLSLVFVVRIISVLGLVSTGFLLFMLLTSNPFIRLFLGPLDGSDLNLLLQDPGLIIHPPMLYTGYVGFSVAFGFAVAALLKLSGFDKVKLLARISKSGDAALKSGDLIGESQNLSVAGSDIIEVVINKVLP